MRKALLNRREFVKLGAMVGGAAALVACGAQETAPPEAVARTDEDEVMVGDVQQYVLATNEWEWDGGWVLFQMHEGRYNGESVYYIRTDASDKAYASREKLVYVPLLGAAKGTSAVNNLYEFDDDRPSVVRYIPADEPYTSLYQRIRVSGDGDYGSEEEILAAADAGTLTLEETDIYVNYPMVEWPGGGLPVDENPTEALGAGPLVEAPNKSRMNVKFKLHKCYPGSRYIVTDTSAIPMAPMMGIAGAAPTQELMDAGATDEIWVFGNGIAGPGVMGFQPAIFDNKAGNPAWSPFWNHFTLTWEDESKARLLKTSAEIRDLIASGDLKEWNGVPDSHPNGFVVNCPAPILSPNDFQPA
ncbi:MAG: twin-arginine translocation signal domain-containing protein [Candidatus Promineifilaceae bacterium]